MREGVAGLLRDKTRKPGLPPLPAAAVDRAVELTLAEPPGKATHWTGWAMAAASGISLLSVQPGLPMKRGRAGTMTHDCICNGTTTLFAALNTLEGTVIAQRMARHRHQEFIRFSEPDRGRSAGGKAHPRDPRQLRRPQASQSTRLARPPSALDLSLHPDLVLLGQCGRRLFRHAQLAAACNAVSSARWSTSKRQSTAIPASTTANPNRSSGPPIPTGSLKRSIVGTKRSRQTLADKSRWKHTRRTAEIRRGQVDSVSPLRLIFTTR